MKAKIFLETIFQDLPDGEHVCVSRGTPKKDGGGMWFKNFKMTDRQFRKWDAFKQDQAWYFCVSTIDGELNEKGTMVGRGRHNLRRYYCLVLDDIGTKAQHPPVEPSWIVETSPGNFQWGYLLDPGSEWGRYEALVEFCHTKGWGDAGAGGSYRLMRVPGSANLKPGRQNFQSVITDAAWDVWTLDELADDLGCNFSELEIKDVNTTTFKQGGAMALEGIDPMLDWLTDNGYVVTDNGSEWIDIICPWADAHTSGANIAGYSPLGRGKGKFIQTRAFSCMHEHCQDKKLTKFREWASKLGAPHVSGYDPLPWLQAKYTYVETGQFVYDLIQRPIGGKWDWTLADWSNKYLEYVSVEGSEQKVLVKTAFLRSDKTRRAVDLCYEPVNPKQDTGIITKLGQDYVNMYVPPNHEYTDEKPEVFLEHIEYLLPKPRHQEIFLNWLAQKIQHPASRSYAIVMIADGVQGTGRSWLKDMLLKVLQHGVNTATMPQLYGMGTSSEQNFTKWKSECQYLVVEESRDNNMSRDDYFHGYQTFKLNCDTKPSVNQDINVKYGRITKETLYYNVLIFSNHSDAMAIPEEDRRTCVLENAGEIKDYAYYDRLVGSLNTQEPRRVFWYLMNRDISGYNHITPPDTAARTRMILDTRGPLEQIGEWLRENHGPDIVTRATLKIAVSVAARELDDEKNAREPSTIAKMLWKKLRLLRLNDPKNGARYVIDGKQTEVRAIRNQVIWEKQDELRDTDFIKKELGKDVTTSNIAHIIDYREEKEES